LLLLGERGFAATGHDSFDANSLVIVTLRQATSAPGLSAANFRQGRFSGLKGQSTVVSQMTCQTDRRS